MLYKANLQDRAVLAMWSEKVSTVQQLNTDTLFKPFNPLLILLELYTNLVLFCKEQHFNREQTSVLISIIKTVHQFNTETPLNNTDHCMTYCSELLLCHSVRRPPFSIDLFSSEQVTLILFYFINTYMRHYFLYKCIFTPEVWSSLNSELRTIVQKEVRDEVMRLTSQLQQRLQDSADQLNDAISKLETNIKVKK
uniref:Si:ch73-81k8.2 n=1 Tax=Sinocyclocheilus grahami TaxID=75366 RepID=A0A672RTH5_SINGR